MIAIGYDITAKQQAIAEWRNARAITRTIVLSPKAFNFPLAHAEFIDWPEIIMYRTFYRLLQEIDQRTLVIVNECLRTQNRYELTYNCIRHFIQQAGHSIIFQWLPLIDDIEDFMILFDFDTRSQWKRSKFDPCLMSEADIHIQHRPVQLEKIDIQADKATHRAYQKERAQVFASIGTGGDPHTAPRRLHLIGGKTRLQATDPFTWVIARNNRFKLARMQTYKEPDYPNAPYDLLDFPHNFIDFADFLAHTKQATIRAPVTDLKADIWYFERFMHWTNRIQNAYTDLSQG